MRFSALSTLNKYIAHKRKSDGESQSLELHLKGVGELALDNASKVGLSDAGYLLGLMHDFGKYSSAFQQYLRSAVGEINFDEDGYVDPLQLKGKIDHSTAGAQWVWREFKNLRKGGNEICGQILSICIASHHSGLIDSISPSGGDKFGVRMSKEDEKTHLNECEKNALTDILSEAGAVVEKLSESMVAKLKKIYNYEVPGCERGKITKDFDMGMLTRFLFSCLVDADRVDSAEFEDPNRKKYRLEAKKYFNWQSAIDRLEQHLANFSDCSNVNSIRKKVSQKCKERFSDAQGVYTLTVPTGGGKTFASLRYALGHAKEHGLDRIVYVIPYTSIIEQNAEEIRKVIEKESDGFSWVLEHHSNLEMEKSTWNNKLTSENWDSPIVLTTMVQFLEALFKHKTSSARRFHHLANSVLIFDEIQTLPIKCVHLFCNALNFLCSHAKTTAVLCTATQPLLNDLKNPEWGNLVMSEKPELAGGPEEIKTNFDQLKKE